MHSDQTSMRAPRSPRYQTLDMWRGIACVLVVIFHSTVVYLADHPTPPDGAFASFAHALLKISGTFKIGVPMFFVISGYCIAATADSARNKNLPATDYFRRRLRRIFPPYWAALALQAVMMILIDVVLFRGLLSDSAHPVRAPWTFSAWQWLGNATLTESWRAHFFGDAQSYILGQAWTLCYEEQFYLVTGLLLFAMRARLFYGAVLVSVLTVLARPLAERYGFPFYGFFFDGSWLMFAAGILVYWTVNYAASFLRFAWIPVLAASVVYARSIDHQNLLYATVFAAVLIVLHRFDAQVMAMRRLAPLRLMGTICYSLYLVHGPTSRAVSQYFANHGLGGTLPTLFISLPIALAVSIALGFVFWRVVERRFLNAPR